MVEVAYAESRFKAPEIPHRYGPGVHLLDDPLAWSLLARACSPETGQPDVGRLVRTLYEMLARVVLAAELPRARVDIPTRMVASHPEAVYRGLALSRATKAVTVGIARAGTMPSQVVYDLMNEVLDPSLVRQDHLFMSRQTNEHGRGHRGDVARRQDRSGRRGSLRAVPRPHGRDGLVHRQRGEVLPDGPDRPPGPLHRHAPHRDAGVPPPRPGRPPRALSSTPSASTAASPRTHVLRTEPGTHWDEERGLNDRHYIVPGAGGVGEILNNAWV